jgi:vacuolar iron transporter family protein
MLKREAKTHRLERRWIREFILGGQDGLVNVLGILLGVAVATSDIKIVLIAGISALFAESISMGAVAYTSSKAALDFYDSMREIEEKEVEEIPDEERKEIRDIYYAKGFRGNLLNQVVNKITSNKKVWIDTMMLEELNLTKGQEEQPIKVGVIVFLATLIGSAVPLLPFVIVPFALPDVTTGMIVSVIISVIVLFLAGALKAKLTIGSWKKSGLELAIIGSLAALAGYLIGKVLEIIFL